MTESVTHHRFDAGDDLDLHIAESGDGPPLVLLHGFTGSAETWTPFRADFAKSYRVIAIDQPGHGQSSAPSNPDLYSLKHFARALPRLLDFLSVERAVVLGYSMGARATLRFAIDHPERVAGLVLESASPGIRDAAQRVDRRAYDAALANDIERDGIESFVNRWERLSLWDSQRSLPDSTRALLRAQRLKNDVQGLANSLRGAGAGEDEPVLEALAGISSPVLLIVGALDTKYMELGRLLEKAMPNSKLRVVAQSGHTVHLEQPEVFTSATMDFLSRIPSSGRSWT